MTTTQAMNVDTERRMAMAEGLRLMADFLTDHKVPLPLAVRGALHITDPDEFDAVCASLDVEVTLGGEFDTARVEFGGDVSYGLQTSSRHRSRLAMREARIEERERELGLRPDDKGGE